MGEKVRLVTTRDVYLSIKGIEVYPYPYRLEKIMTND